MVIDSSGIGLSVPVISVIVPVYNVEKYLRRCIDSILAQTFTNFECILVDDGSPDACPAICDEAASKDVRIRVLHGENRGTAFARDAGVRRAVGEFLVFVDPDDWAEPNMLEALYQKQLETGADVVLGGFRWFESDTLTREYTYPDIPDEVSCLSYGLQISQAVWGKLYRKTLWANLITEKIRRGQDVFSNFQIFLNLPRDKLQKIGTIIYNYDQTTGGITSLAHTPVKSYVGDIQFFHCIRIERYIQRLPYNAEAYSVLAVWMINMLHGYVMQQKGLRKNERRIFFKRYWRRCLPEHKRLFPLHKRIMLPLFYLPRPAGYIYALFLQFLSDFCGSLHRCIHRLETLGLSGTARFYYRKICERGGAQINQRLPEKA